MRLSICRAMCLLGRTAIDKAISVKADSLYLLRRRPPNLLKVQILFLKGARDQIGGNLFWSKLVFPARLDLCCQPEPFGENTVSGIVRKSKKAKRLRPLPLWRMYTGLWVSLHRFGISDFRFGISDFEIRISESGFQCLVGNHCHKRANFCRGVKGDFGGAGGLAEG